ncbi:hypothetical protein [Shimazuella kribbensis]|uniref:hypothetical protein n=1 Tax=Shimazuella kribbensis TaxID=139808 RepID=UPI0003FB32B2|nr:hypothetical protein [Shimazuella kribbensis]
MKKIIYSFLLLAVFGLVMSGCTINLSANEKQPNLSISTTSNNQENKGENPIQIKVDIYKHYEDGFALQMYLANAKTGKGTWTIKTCEKENVHKNKGASILVGSEEVECVGKMDSGSYNIYINFTGIVNGQQITLDKVYEWDYKELDNVPLDGSEEKPEKMSWETLKVNAQGGFLFNYMAYLGATKEDILTYLGNPDPSDEEGILEYKNENLSIGIYDNQTVSFLSVENPDKLSSNLDEIQQVFGDSKKISAPGGDFLKYNLGANTLYIWFNDKAKITNIDLEPSDS